MNLEALQYPIGRFELPTTVPAEALVQAIADITALPKALFQVVSPLTPTELDRPYRPGGWTVRQLVHHCADSHAQVLGRIKLALTEDNPTVKPYDENAWVALADAQLPVELALDLLCLTHAKWVQLLQAMTDVDFQRSYFHPEKQRSQTLTEVTLMYAWHGNHHLAHVEALVARNFDR
jgi:hypothetical protein